MLVFDVDSGKVKGNPATLSSIKGVIRHSAVELNTNISQHWVIDYRSWQIKVHKQDLLR